MGLGPFTAASVSAGPFPVDVPSLAEVGESFADAGPADESRLLVAPVRDRRDAYRVA